MTKFAMSLGVTGVVANPAILQSLNNMQFGNNGMPAMGQPSMDPNMAAAMYQQQMFQQQQAQQQQAAELIERAGLAEELLAEREQMFGYLQQQQEVIEGQSREIYQLQNPDALDPESVDRALCLSAAVEGSPWDAMRNRLRNVLDSNTAMLPLDQAKKLLDNVLQQFSSSETAPNGEDCGMGVLSLHLLNAMTMDDTEENRAALIYIFSEYEPLTSPVLTLMLDLPWESILRSNWPLFGMLSQIHHRKLEVMDLEELNGFNHTATRDFHTELMNNLGRRDWEGIRAVSEKFIDESLSETPSPLCMLTAFLGQAMKTTDRELRESVLAYTQDQFKRMVASGSDMDAVLGSAWPVMQMLHAFMY